MIAILLNVPNKSLIILSFRNLVIYTCQLVNSCEKRELVAQKMVISLNLA